MRILLAIWVLLSSFTGIWAQQIHWAHFISSSQIDDLESHAIDKDGNIVAVGYFEETISLGDFTLTSKDQSDIFIYKTNSFGQVLWAHNLGGPLYGGDVGVTVDGEANIYVTGGYIDKLYFDNNLKLSTPQNSVYWSSFIAKINSAGNLLWIKGIYPSAISEVRTWGNIDVNDQGSLVVAGMFSGTINIDGTELSNPLGFPGNSIFICRLTTNGDLVWVKNPPSDTYAMVQDIQLDEASNIYFTGFFTNSIWFGTTKLTAADDGHSDIFTAKYEPGGNALWAKSIVKTTAAELNNEGRALCVDEATGNVIVVGIFNGTITTGAFTISGENTSENGVADGFLATYSSNGSIQWLKRLGTPNSDILHDVILTDRNSMIVAGGIDGLQLFFEEITLAGVSVFRKEFNGVGLVQNISFAQEGVLYLSGILFNSLTEDAINFTPQGQDGFLMKYAPGEPPEPPATGFIPNVITPHIDAFNDTFKIPFNMEGSPIVIYNRWGEVVYSSSDYRSTWDGGNHPTGVYYYQMQTTCCGYIKGIVNIVR